MAAKSNESVILTEEERELLAKYRNKVSEANGMFKGQQNYFIANKHTETKKHPLKNGTNHLNAIRFDANKDINKGLHVKKLTERERKPQDHFVTFSSERNSLKQISTSNERIRDTEEESKGIAKDVEERKRVYLTAENRSSRRILVAELKDLEANIKSEPTKENLYFNSTSRELHQNEGQNYNDTITLDNESLENLLQSNSGVNLKMCLNAVESTSLPSYKNTTEVQTETSQQKNIQSKEHEVLQKDYNAELAHDKKLSKIDKCTEARRCRAKKAKMPKSDSIPPRKAKKFNDSSHILKVKDAPEKRNALTKRMKSKINEVLDKNERLWQLVKKHSKECPLFAAELKKQGLL